MSAHGYRQFLPGDAVSLELEIRYPRMHLREAGVTFRHEEHDRWELSASGPVEGLTNTKVTPLSFSVPGGTMPGLYRANELWVETYGGRVYRYEGEEMAHIASMIAFEVLEEPDEKPEVSLGYR